MGAFEPEYSGKMNFYVSAIDDILREPGDNPTIGLILCRSIAVPKLLGYSQTLTGKDFSAASVFHSPENRYKSKAIVELALKGMEKPIGVASYVLREDLPSELHDSLPTIEQLELEMATIVAKIETGER